MTEIRYKEYTLKYFIFLILILLTLFNSNEGDSAQTKESEDEIWEGESDQRWVEENANIDEKKKNESKDVPRIYPDQSGSEQTMDEEMREKVPKMYPDDATSYYMPEYYWCDGCRVVAYQIIKTLDEAHRKRPSIVRISEVDLVDLLEGLCNDGFEEYGMVEHNGNNRLAGPGLETEDTEGYRLTGGRWPHRLRVMCGEYIGEIEEVDLYKQYLKDKDLFTSYLCQGPGIRNKCGELDYSKYNQRKDEF